MLEQIHFEMYYSGKNTYNEKKWNVKKIDIVFDSHQFFDPCKTFMDPCYPATHAKIWTHATHARI